MSGFASHNKRKKLCLFVWSFSFLDSICVLFSLFCQVNPWVKTSLAPGSGVVTKYLLQRYFVLHIESNLYYNVVTSPLHNLGKIYSDLLFVSTFLAVDCKNI